MSKVAAEAAIKDALLVGNFEAAVECCFRSGNLADALVLASCGGAELWQKTQTEYFTRESKQRPYLSLVHAVINDQLNELVSTSDPANWRETLAVLSTYAKSDEFPTLCAVLGDRLEDGGDYANASLCYMCALKLGDAIRYWKFTLQSAKMADDGTDTTDLLSLHDFIEKVTVFTQAIDSSQVVLDDDVANLFTDYAKALTNQGLCVSAAKYLKGFNTQECNELRDRIYCGRMGRFCSDLQASPPDFPFDFVNVGIANDLYGITVKQGGGSKEQHQFQQENHLAFNSTDANYTTKQNHEGQSQHHVQQPSPQFEPTPDPGVDPSLPPGWVALQDPSSGQTYYANQSTGESSWDPPQMMIPAAVPSPVLQPVTNSSYAAQTVVQPVVKNVSFNTTNGSSTSTSQKVASKYGDGFVTSASNPVLAEQYGNVGTSNPYTNANRPGTAAAAVGNTPKKAPISGTWDPDSMPELSAEHKELQDGLMSIVDRLLISAVGSMETKQATESQKAVAVFIKTVVRGGMDDDIVNKVRLMMYNLQNRDYASASSIVTGLVSNEWKDHKDWLKGMKFLVQMVTKKQL
jgi:protein transport protein SEC31